MTEPDLTETEAAERAFAKALFAPDPDDTEEPADEHKPPGGNYVPKEGNVPETPADDGMRAFTRELFGFDPA